MRQHKIASQSPLRQWQQAIHGTFLTLYFRFVLERCVMKQTILQCGG